MIIAGNRRSPSAATRCSATSRLGVTTVGGPNTDGSMRRRLAPAQKRTDMCEGDAGGGQIEPSDSPWASPVVLVTKKDGTTRFCVDYRRLNALTTKDAYPLPRIDDSLRLLGNQQWFSTMDLASGYWQVAMSPEAKRKVVFVTNEGLFQLRVMPFGVRGWIQSKSTSAWAECAGLSPELRCWRLQIGNLSLDTEGRLWRRRAPPAECSQLVVPLNERPAMIRRFHDSLFAGQLGISRTIFRLQTRVYWPGLRNMHSMHSKKIAVPT